MTAIISTGILAPEIRGVIDGVVFSDGLGGPYVRALVTPFNPETPAQAAVRQTLTEISTGFQALTPEQQEAWYEFSKEHVYTNSLGQPTKGNAVSAFVQLNSNRILLCAESAPTLLEDPPADQDVQKMTDVEFDLIGTASPTLQVTPKPKDDLEADSWLCLRISRLIPPGTTRDKSITVRRAGFVECPNLDPGPPPSYTFDLVDAESWAGQIVVGARIVCSLQRTNYLNGSTTRPVRAIVTAVSP